MVGVQNTFTSLYTNLAIGWEQTWNLLADIFRGFLNVIDEEIASAQIQFAKMTSLSKEGKEKRIAGIKDRTAANKAARAAASEDSNKRVAALQAQGDSIMAGRLAALPGPAAPAMPEEAPAPVAAIAEAGTNFAEQVLAAERQNGQGVALGGAGEAAKTKSEVMGTFSSFAAGGMGVGNNLAERQLKVAEETRDAILAGNQVQE